MKPAVPGGGDGEAIELDGAAGGAVFHLVCEDGADGQVTFLSGAGFFVLVFARDGDEFVDLVHVLAAEKVVEFEPGVDVEKGEVTSPGDRGDEDGEHEEQEEEIAGEC